MIRNQHLAQLALAVCLSGAALLALPAHAETGRVIVKFRSSSTIQVLSSDSARIQAMSAQTGLKVLASNNLIGRMHAMRVDGISSSELATRLAARADVEYAVPDERRYIRAVPSDPVYAQQWYLQSTKASAINAQSAWDSTTGSSSVVVAVLDTGILPNHPDLTSKLTYNGSTLYGYDFVSNAEVANDGDGRDADPSDPGDWVTTTESTTTSGIFFGCTVTDSTWHGSMVAGIIGAASNNAQGVAGVAWGAKILPVRVMGKCGGYDSDILAGMLWAAGLSVSGVSTNIYPAKVINMSIGGTGTCNSAYTDVVKQVIVAGSTILAAAGNDAGSVGVPANCPGVVAVSALNNTGSKAYYSDFGSAAGIAAPGGDCGSATTSATCEYPIYSTKNSGTTSPQTDNYSVASDAERGTSFATPLVAGVVALMRSANSSLTPALLVARLKASASAFPTVTGLQSCSAVASGTRVDCNCTTSTCGAGMLNAANAVSAALRPVAVITAASSATAGDSLSLSSTGSTVADGHTIASYLWTTSAGSITNATQASATLAASIAGTVTVTLTITDDAGKTDTASTTIAVAEAPSSGGGGGAIDAWSLLLLLALAGVVYCGRALRR
ncbi:S8 family serine peptidase [Uliginosibacterium gangwonense]|uniref:S8 family serine peptidase n=1 Tax=Uliginosibacterium gangwonense TaxID=392736 RepID=UPI000364096C|nr:S8 family serine peptidase [Uliginosibacterium gangwonense]